MRLPTVFVALLAIAIAGCGARRSVEERERPAPPLFVYVSGVASAHYCTCARWPVSWVELERFDDALHVFAQAQGQKPMARIPWALYADSQVETAPDEDLLLSLRRQGTEQFDIRVPYPECTHADPQVVERLCAGPQ